MSRLTSRSLATGASLNDLIHIVITGDTSQNAAGSSYKSTLSQLQPLFLFTGGSSNCITNLYVDNVRACTNEITVFNRVQSTGSDAQNTLSFAFGNNTKALNAYTHAEGENTIASGQTSHVEGSGTTTYGSYSHAEGNKTQTGAYGAYTVTGITNGVVSLSSTYGNVTGDYTTNGWVYLGNTAYEGGYEVSGVSYSLGRTVITLYDTSINEGSCLISDTNSPIYWGGDQIVGGLNAHSEGNYTYAIGSNSNTNGYLSITYGVNSFAAGFGSLAYGNSSTAFGGGQAFGTQSVALGPSVAYGGYSHSEGQGTASGSGSHAEGASTAIGMLSHSEGSSTASGDFSHAEGESTLASGQYSHSQGKGTEAYGDSSHAGGVGTKSGSLAFSHGEINYARNGWGSILGGRLNTITSGTTGYETSGSTIIGSSYSSISGLTPSDPVYDSSILGGNSNSVNSFNSSIISSQNSKLSADHSVIIGGSNITGTTSNTVYVPKIRLVTSGTPSSSADAQGEPGSLLWDNTYFYYKDNSGWKRISGTTW